MLIISPFLYRVISKFINIQFRMINYNNLHFACKVRYRSVNKRVYFSHFNNVLIIFVFYSFWKIHLRWLIHK